MIVEQYGLVYERLQEKDIELVRFWRNQPFILETMQFQEYITGEMQKEWFNRINNKYNYYFIIIADGKKIGLLSCKDTEPETRIAEGGIFIWDKDYWGTVVPVFASLSMLECIFEVFKSGDTSVATVNVNNKRAITFNKLLGYKIIESNEKTVKLMLTKEDYYQKTKVLMRSAHLYCKGNSKIEIIAEPNEFLADEINDYLTKNKFK
jgi:RimJ/RimL family protein N-acetyltransferase